MTEAINSAATVSHSREAVLRSGQVQLHPGTRELLRDGEAVAIERRAFDLLHYLMRHPDRVVNKDELWREVWQSRPVTDSTLPQAVSRIRKALGQDDPERFIATVFGVGYRFVAAVDECPVDASQGAGHGSAVARTPPQRAARVRPQWAVTLLVLLGLLLLAWQHWRDSVQAPARVAVLPLINETGNSELDWAGLGALALIDGALAERGVERVGSTTVLATLRRHPEATDLQAQAEVLRQNTGAVRVLAASLTQDGDEFRLDLRPIGDALAAPSSSLVGVDVAVLAVAAGQQLADSLDASLARWQGAERARRSLLTDDPFINEAFARGLDARLRGRHAQAVQYFETVLAAAPELLEAKYHLSLVSRRTGDWERTDRLNRELLASAEASGDLPMLAAVQSASGTLAWRRGEKAQAARWYQQALDNYLSMGNADYIASNTANLGILAANAGQYDLAEQRFREALSHYRRVGDRYNEATTLKNLGHLEVDRGRYQRAESWLQQALAIRQALALPLPIARTLSVLGDIDMARGRWSQAASRQRQVLEVAVEHADPQMRARASADLAAALRQQGELQQAGELAQLALDLAEQLDHPVNRAHALRVLADVHASFGETQRAIEFYRRAAATYAEIDEPLGQAQSLLSEAETLIAVGQPEPAQLAVDAAADLIATASLDRLQVRLFAARGRLAGQLDDADTAITLLRRAYALASSREVSVEALDVGGYYGLRLLAEQPKDDDLAGLLERLTIDPRASEPALRFLIAYYAERDRAQALHFAQTRQRLLGEAWSEDDQRQLQALR